MKFPFPLTDEILPESCLSVRLPPSAGAKYPAMPDNFLPVCLRHPFGHTALQTAVMPHTTTPIFQNSFPMRRACSSPASASETSESLFPEDCDNIFPSHNSAPSPDEAPHCESIILIPWNDPQLLYNSPERYQNLLSVHNTCHPGCRVLSFFLPSIPDPSPTEGKLETAARNKISVFHHTEAWSCYAATSQASPPPVGLR